MAKVDGVVFRIPMRYADGLRAEVDGGGRVYAIIVVE